MTYLADTLLLAGVDKVVLGALDEAPGAVSGIGCRVNNWRSSRRSLSRSSLLATARMSSASTGGQTADQSSTDRIHPHLDGDPTEGWPRHSTQTSVVDLLVAATAQAWDLTVLHVDADFDTVAGVTELRTQRADKP